jgi:hypothetical protein
MQLGTGINRSISISEASVGNASILSHETLYDPYATPYAKTRSNMTVYSVDTPSSLSTDRISSVEPPFISYPAPVVDQQQPTEADKLLESLVAFLQAASYSGQIDMDDSIEGFYLPQNDF